MTKRALYFLLCVLIFVSCSTKKAQIRKDLLAFQNQEIVVPANFIEVCEGQLRLYSPDTLPHFVVYVDSSFCSGCTIGRLHDYDGLYEMSRETGAFSVMMIFSPREEEFVTVMDDLVNCEYENAVLLDVGGAFAHQNPHIPQDARFHYFLLDGRGYPVFVGNPLQTEKLYDLFIELLL